MKPVIESSMKYFVSTLLAVFLLLLAPGNSNAFRSDIRYKKGLPLMATDSITGPSNFNDIKVIDLRKEKDTIGYHINRYESTVVVSDSVAASVTALGYQVIHSASGKANQQLLIVIKDIYLGSKDEDGSLHFKTDFYLGKAGQYHLISSMDSLYQFRWYRSVIVENATAYLNDVFTYSIINCARATFSPKDSVLDMEAILHQDEIAKSKQPVYSEKPKDGIYYSYKDFIANKPADTAFLYVPYYYYDQKTDHFYLPGEGKKYGKNLADTACFAICYKGKWYKEFNGDDFKEMKMEDGDFVYLAILPSVRYYGKFLKPGISVMKYHMHYSEPIDISQLKYDKRIYKLKIDAVTGKSYKFRAFPGYLEINNSKSLHI